MQVSDKTGSGKVAWRSPSNIALVKYWGKRPVQVPENPSLSITLSKAFSEMSLEYFPREEAKDGKWLSLSFEGNPQEKFERKMTEFLHALLPAFPALKAFSFNISSHNTFPHSTGIASSASSMSALGLCLAEFISLQNRESLPEAAFLRNASVLARLASGSACRSVYGGYVIWGQVEGLPGTSDDYAIPFPREVHPAFRSMKDSILVVSDREKEVSSRAGHALMESHPYAKQRYRMAAGNTLDLVRALQEGDWDAFIRITELEALNLHALMMSSDPSYLLIEPNTLNIVNSVRRFRKETNVPVCFTLDAGPNVHVIYPAENDKEVKKWIVNELALYCKNGRWIDDEMGKGPEKLE